MAFLISNNDLKDTKVVLLSELSKDLHLSTEFNEKNKRGEYKQIQADFRIDDVKY